MSSARLPHAVAVLYRVLLRCYPREVRERFGEDMTVTFADAFCARRDRWARATFLFGAVADALCTGIAERAGEWRVHPRTPGAVGVPISGDTAMQSIVQDVRFAVRSLARRPGFVAAVTLTLALGIGANTAMFSLLDAVLLHPLPAISHPDQVVSVYRAASERSRYEGVSYPVFKAMAERTRALSGLAGLAGTTVAARVNSRTEELEVECVSGNFFALLGLRPQAGRLLVSSDDDVPGAHPVVVLSDALWRRAFNRDPAAVGGTIELGGRPFTIVGVAPAGFRGTSLSSDPQLWVPLTMLTSLGTGGLLKMLGSQVYTARAFTFFGLVGRLRPSATPSSAAAELNTIFASEGRSSGREGRNPVKVITPTDVMRHAPGVKQPISVVPIVETAALGNRASLVRFVTILLTVVGLTLLIACVNVANLMLVRAGERARELGVRAALGASRVALVRQLVVESLMLASVGAAAGMVVGKLTMHLLAAFTLPGHISLHRAGLSLDGRVLAFTVALAVVTAILFGLVPAIRASRADLAAVFTTHGAAARRAPTGALAGVQVALSTLLLVGAALFVRSLRAGLSTDIGFDPRPLAAIEVQPQLHGYTADRSNAYYMEAIARARALPGVTAAAVAMQVPLSPMLKFPFPRTASSNAEPGDTTVRAGLNAVSPGYFDALHVSFVAGRDFTSADGKGAPRVVILNEAAARAFQPTGTILGKPLGKSWGTVVGIVHDTKYQSLGDDHIPTVFTPIAQENPTGTATVVVRSDHPARTLTALRHALADIDPNVPLRNARVVSDQIDTILMPQRFGATLLGIFAIISLCVSAVGIYGVIAYAVSQRASEIAVRIALGAQDADILRLVLVRIGIAVTVGGAIGFGASMLASRTLEQFLYGITPLDSMAFIGAALLLAIAAALACCIPAARATRIDPMTTLRSE